MQKFDSLNTNISLYLTLFEIQARAAGIEEEEWVLQLISLLPLDLAQIIIKEPEEQMREYTNVKKVLLDRFKMKLELQNYFDGWIEGLNVKDFKGLKELMIADQLKRRVSNEVKDHFLDEWGELIDPLVLAGKLDQYESVRGHRKVNPVRMAERKPLDRARPHSPRKEHPAKNAEKTEHQFGKISSPKGNWRSEKCERRTQPACYICHSTSHLRPNCPQLNKSKELINRVGISDQVENLFAPYLSKALINNAEMDILRDTGASIDIVSRNRVRPEHFTGGVVFVKQPLDAEFRCLPLAKVELQSPEFGCVVTKAAVIDAQLGSGWYLLSNKTYELILEAKRKTNLNTVVTRNQTNQTDKKDLAQSNEREGTVATTKEPEAIITDDPYSLTLPPAEKIGERIVEVSSEELREAQKGCSTLQACFLQAEKGNSDFRVEGEMMFRESKDHFGNVSLQVVIPQVYRDKILALCHEGTSSHLGVRKTKDRFLKHYF
ncbi:hypothetical protein AVEN_240331-1 [Araneus ventricosus]|uniref:Integrase zinc-binding domain-containing protein n=1 Tax=Araneus ventricosus TaxID=182803 RepID=A0A4Y2F3P0_ARAVE|nr:hypothetical protein AVEN_240331-1 [Araneus ventricosus]